MYSKILDQCLFFWLEQFKNKISINKINKRKLQFLLELCPVYKSYLKIYFLKSIGTFHNSFFLSKIFDPTHLDKNISTCAKI